MPSFTSYLHKCQVKHRRWTLWVMPWKYPPEKLRVCTWKRMLDILYSFLLGQKAYFQRRTVSFGGVVLKMLTKWIPVQQYRTLWPASNPEKNTGLYNVYIYICISRMYCGRFCWISIMNIHITATQPIVHLDPTTTISTEQGVETKGRQGGLEISCIATLRS